MNKYTRNSLIPVFIIFLAANILNIIAWQVLHAISGNAFWMLTVYITLLSVLSLSLILGKGLHLDMQAERASRHKDFQKFLQHIAYGEQKEAEALLEVSPELVYGRGNVTDYSQRSFKRVTAFQYAVWALDWHMWSMLRRYLPDAAAA